MTIYGNVICFTALFFISCFPGLAAQADTSDSAFTSYQKVAESLYPPSQMSKFHRRPTDFEKEWLDRGVRVAVEQIEAIDVHWFRKITANYSDQDFNDTMRYLRESPIWICLDQCKCPEKSPLGCAQGKFYGEVLGTVITLNSCLFDEGKKCKPSQGKKKNELLFEALAKSASQIAFYKATLRNTGYEKKLVASYELLMESVNSLGAIQSQCQSSPETSFSISALSALKKTGRFRELGPFQDVCVRKLVDLFRVATMPKACALALNRKLWDAHWRFGILKEHSPKAVRCEGVCDRVTCGDSLARPMGFSGHWFLSVPEGVCEGQKPVNSREFIRKTIERYLNAETKSLEAEKRQTLVSGCEAGFLDRL